MFRRLGHCRGRWRWQLSDLCQLHLPQQWPNLWNIGPIYGILRYFLSQPRSTLCTCCSVPMLQVKKWQNWTMANCDVAFSTFAGMGMGLCGWMARPKKCLICLVDCCPPPVAPVMLALWKEKESNYTLKVILPPPTHHQRGPESKACKIFGNPLLVGYIILREILCHFCRKQITTESWERH